MFASRTGQVHEHEAIALGDVRNFNISDQDRQAILKNMYSLTPDAVLWRTGKDAFDAMKMLQSMDKESPDNPEERTALASGPGSPQGRNKQLRLLLIRP